MPAVTSEDDPMAKRKDTRTKKGSRPTQQGSIETFMKRREEVAEADRAELRTNLARARNADVVVAEAQRHPIVREVVDTHADMRGQSLGNWIALLPTKMGGGTYAIDLHSNRVLGSIWYWNYGDYCPISHHL